eukprot:1851063-Amphidinium_carterae.3
MAPQDWHESWDGTTKPPTGGKPLQLLPGAPQSEKYGLEKVYKFGGALPIPVKSNCVETVLRVELADPSTNILPGFIIERALKLGYNNTEQLLFLTFRGLQPSEDLSKMRLGTAPERQDWRPNGDACKKYHTRVMGRCFRCGSPHHGLAACSRPTRPTNRGPEASAANSTPYNPKQTPQRNPKGKGKETSKPKGSQQVLMLKKRTLGRKEEKIGMKEGKKNGLRRWQLEAAHADIEDDVFCAKVHSTPRSTTFKPDWGLAKLSAFIPSSEVKTEMIYQSTGERYVSRERKHRPGQKADRLGFQWKEVTISGSLWHDPPMEVCKGASPQGLSPKEAYLRSEHASPLLPQG